MGEPQKKVIPDINDKPLAELRSKLRPMVRLEGTAPGSHEKSSTPLVNVEGKGNLYFLVPGDPRRSYHGYKPQSEVPESTMCRVGREKCIFLPFDPGNPFPTPSEAMVLAQLPKRLPKTANAYEVQRNIIRPFRKQGEQSYWRATLILYRIDPTG